MKAIISSVRQGSTLADKLRAAASTNYQNEMAKLQANEASSSVRFAIVSFNISIHF